MRERYLDALEALFDASICLHRGSDDVLVLIAFIEVRSSIQVEFICVVLLFDHLFVARNDYFGGFHSWDRRV